MIELVSCWFNYVKFDCDLPHVGYIQGEISRFCIQSTWLGKINNFQYNQHFYITLANLVLCGQCSRDVCLKLVFKCTLFECLYQSGHQQSLIGNSVPVIASKTRPPAGLHYLTFHCFPPLCFFALIRLLKKWNSDSRQNDTPIHRSFSGRATFFYFLFLAQAYLPWQVQETELEKVTPSIVCIQALLPRQSLKRCIIQQCDKSCFCFSLSLFCGHQRTNWRSVVFEQMNGRAIWCVTHRAWKAIHQNYVLWTNMILNRDALDTEGMI